MKLYGLIRKLYGLERNCMVSNHESYGLGRVWGRPVCLWWWNLDNKVNTMAADALVPCVTRSSATMILTVHWISRSLCSMRKVQPPVRSQCWEIIKNANDIFMFPELNSAWQWVNYGTLVQGHHASAKWPFQIIKYGHYHVKACLAMPVDYHVLERPCLFSSLSSEWLG